MHINSKTEIYGLIGYPVKHTYSPLMHNAAFEALGINAVYLAFEVSPENLKATLHCIKSLGIRGLNVTIPHKESVIKYLDEIDREASLIKAVNVIINKNGRLKGYNTDGRGFLRSLKEDFGISPSGRKFFIMGAGGAARAVSFSLALGGAGRIVLVDAVREKALKLVSSLKKFTRCDAIALESDRRAIREMIFNSDVLINATPCGMKPEDPGVIEPDCLRKGLLVYDLIYNPAVTKLMKDGRAKGALISNGLGMLLYQGAISFELWTGKKAPVAVMKKALDSRFTS